MNKQKLKIALALVAAPLVLASTMSSSWASCNHRHHYCHKCCHSCYSTKNMALAGRVVERLRGDISLADQPIMVTAYGHKVVLCGRVLSPQQRYIAVQIARYTCGVRLVVDALRTAQP